MYLGEDDDLEADEVNEAEAEDTSEVEDQDEIETPSHFNEDGSLKENENYEANGYHYQTDEQGRLESVTGDLRLEKGTRNLQAQREVGGEDREDYDDGGHLIATRFGGSGEIDNLVPMSQDINRRGGEWYDLEDSWAKELENDNEVNVQIYIEYDDSKRPEGFDVMWSVKDKDTGETKNYHEYIENVHA